MKTLLVTAAFAVMLTATAHAGDLADVLDMALEKRFGPITDVDYSSKDEVVFYTKDWHMACRYTVARSYPFVRIGKCRKIHA